MRDTIKFALDGEIVSLKNVDPTRTVLQYLREDRLRVGSKEGCAEGDCGACTVVVAELAADTDRLHYKAINSCIQFLPTLDGKALITVESLESKNGLHPVQRAMVDCDGSQCGFCTPGFIMSMFAMYKTQQSPTRTDIDNALAGNLCRCTGYRPIADAAVKMYEYDDHSTPLESRTVELLRSLATNETLHVANGGRQFFAPTDVDGLAGILEQHPDACILAGGTDVGLWVTKQFRDLQTVVYTGNVAQMRSTNVRSTHIDIGAAVTLSDAMPVLSKHYPELDELFLRFASPPIRNAGTLGGNVANGSPIGDSMPVLIALGASIVLRKGATTREMALDDFYLDYQKTALNAGEFVERVRIPLPHSGQVIRSYKLSKRFDQDISAVCAGYAIDLENGRVESARIAYGGVAAIPKRAAKCEAQLIGKDWNEKTVRAAMVALDDDFTPLSDMRSSAQYRQTTSRNLLYRFYLETTGNAGETNVYSYGR